MSFEESRLPPSTGLLALTCAISGGLASIWVTEQLFPDTLFKTPIDALLAALIAATASAMIAAGAARRSVGHLFAYTGLLGAFVVGGLMTSGMARGFLSDMKLPSTLDDFIGLGVYSMIVVLSSVLSSGFGALLGVAAAFVNLVPVALTIRGQRRRHPNETNRSGLVCAAWLGLVSSAALHHACWKHAPSLLEIASSTTGAVVSVTMALFGLAGSARALWRGSSWVTSEPRAPWPS